MEGRAVGEGGVAVCGLMKQPHSQFYMKTFDFDGDRFGFAVPLSVS